MARKKSTRITSVLDEDTLVHLREYQPKGMFTSRQSQIEHIFRLAYELSTTPSLTLSKANVTVQPFPSLVSIRVDQDVIVETKGWSIPETWKGDTNFIAWVLNKIRQYGEGYVVIAVSTYLRINRISLERLMLYSKKSAYGNTKKNTAPNTHAFTSLRGKDTHK